MQDMQDRMLVSFLQAFMEGELNVIIWCYLLEYKK